MKHKEQGFFNLKSCQVFQLALSALFEDLSYGSTAIISFFQWGSTLDVRI